MTTTSRVLAGVLGSLAILGVTATGHAQQLETIPADEYVAACLVCHGTTGKGDGPLAVFLKVPPSDLTTIAKRNDGEFPFLKVFQTIDGRAQIGAHGTRDMPVWGDRYKAVAGERYGPYGAEQIVRGRILELVYYIQSLQEK